MCSPSRSSFRTISSIVASFGLLAAMGNSTRAFVENIGQVRDQHGKANPAVLYLLQGQGNNVALRRGGFSYDTYTVTEHKRGDAEGYAPLPERQVTQLLKEHTYQFHRVDIDFVGGDPDAVVEAVGPLDCVLHYYTSEVPATDVRSFKRIVMRNVWPNIDVEFRCDGTFEYDFILHPGADIHDIRLEYNGMDRAELKDGCIALTVAPGQLIERIPMSYFQRDLRAVDIHYALRESPSGAFVVGFSGHQGPITETLVIDPTPNRDWGTYYGGSAYDLGYGVATDVVGNVTITGLTGSSSAIATAGAHQTTFVATWDAFVARFDATGARLWATYLGGAGDDYGMDLVCGTSNEVYVTGYAGTSAFIASAGAHQTVHGGTVSDAFLVKLSNTGVRLWGTYYGGAGNDQGQDVALDPTGNVCMVGNTTSAAGIGTAGTHQPTAVGNWDAFIAKFSPTGVRQWGTYMGGTAADNGNSITVDGAGSIVVCGSTASTAGISTAGAHQATWAGGTGSDGFFAKFSATGTRTWGTYYGGTLNDVLWGVAHDASNNIVVVGGTYSTTNLFGTAGAHDPTFGGYHDAVISSFTPAGTRAWGTYFGAASGDMAYSVAVDWSNTILVTGYTEGGAGLSTAGSAQPGYGGVLDAFVLRLSATGARQWCTFYGGTNQDNAWDIATYNTNSIYIVGLAYSTGAIATAGSHQTVNATNQDAFLAKFSDATPVMLPVELVSFTAKDEGHEGVLTSWVTASETDNAHFTIERAKEDGSVFSGIGRIEGAGNSQSTLHYSWTDPEPLPGLSYYRLRQTDFDGTSTVSHTVAILRSGNGLLQAVAQGDAVMVQLGAAAEVDVLDASGRLVHHAAWAEGVHTISTSDWSPGVYQVVAYGERSERTLQRVVVAQ